MRPGRKILLFAACATLLSITGFRPSRAGAGEGDENFLAGAVIEPGLERGVSIIYKGGQAVGSIGADGTIIAHGAVAGSIRNGWERGEQIVRMHGKDVGVLNPTLERGPDKIFRRGGRSVGVVRYRR